MSALFNYKSLYYKIVTYYMHLASIMSKTNYTATWHQLPYIVRMISASLSLLFAILSSTTPTHLKPIIDVLEVFTISCNNGCLKMPVMPNLVVVGCNPLAPNSVLFLSTTDHVSIKPSVMEQLIVVWVLIGINNGPSGSNDTINGWQI